MCRQCSFEHVSLEVDQKMALEGLAGGWPTLRCRFLCDLCQPCHLLTVIAKARSRGAWFLCGEAIPTLVAFRMLIASSDSDLGLLSFVGPSRIADMASTDFPRFTLRVAEPP